MLEATLSVRGRIIIGAQKGAFVMVTFHVGRETERERERERCMYIYIYIYIYFYTLPQTNMETHITPFHRDCSLCRALFGFPC